MNKNSYSTSSIFDFYTANCSEKYSVLEYKELEMDKNKNCVFNKKVKKLKKRWR